MAIKEDDNQSEDGSSSMVAIAAGISGGIVVLVILLAVLVILLAVCVCTVCLSRHVQVHVHNNEKHNKDRKKLQVMMRLTPMRYTDNLTWLTVMYLTGQPQRTANRIDPQQSMWLNQTRLVKQSHESRLGQIEHEKGAHWTLTNNALYQHGNLIQKHTANPREHGHFAVPVIYITSSQ